MPSVCRGDDGGVTARGTGDEPRVQPAVGRARQADPDHPAGAMSLYR